MIYALRLGELATGEGPASIYVGLTETHVLPPAIAQSDEDGLRQLIAHGGGAELVCEPALAGAARRLVLGTAPPPPWTAIPCAELATAIHLGPALERPAMAAIVPAIVAACEFVAAAPWRHFLNADAIDFVVERAGRARRQLEGCIMGAGGQEFGVALYDQPGSLARLAALLDAGQMRDARKIDALGLTIDDGPAWVAAAVERAFELDVVLSPVRVRRGATRPVSATELMLLASATAAAAKLDPEHLEARATAGQGQDMVTVVARVRAKAPARPPGPSKRPVPRPRSGQGKSRRRK